MKKGTRIRRGRPIRDAVLEAMKVLGNGASAADVWKWIKKTKRLQCSVYTVSGYMSNVRASRPAEFPKIRLRSTPPVVAIWKELGWDARPEDVQTKFLKKHKLPISRSAVWNVRHRYLIANPGENYKTLPPPAAGSRLSEHMRHLASLLIAKSYYLERDMPAEESDETNPTIPGDNGVSVEIFPNHKVPNVLVTVRNENTDVETASYEF